MAMPSRKPIKTMFVPTFLALLVSACTSVNPLTESVKEEAYSSSEFYINKADQTKKLEDKISYQLLATRKLLEENKLNEAQDTFNDLQAVEIQKAIAENPVHKIEYDLVLAQLSAWQGKNLIAQNSLKNLKNVQLSRTQTLRVYQTQARLAENQQNVEEIVRARSLFNHYLNNNKLRQENNDKIWETLRQANRGIEKAQALPGEMEFAGWIALISLYNQNVTTPAQMPQALAQWKSQYPNHTAVSLMPTELKNVNAYQQTQLNGVALLLPLSGDAQILGEIVKRGFNDAKGNHPSEVNVYDTETDEINVLLAKAKANGAGMIVGPLLKERVEQALHSPEINGVNLLALNSTPNVRGIPQVCYYGLSPESEAKAGAERLYRDGHRVAMVAVPQGDFGQRSADAFAERWRQLSGMDADVRYYSSPEDAVASVLSANIEKAGLYLLGTAEEVLGIKQGIDSSDFKDKLAIYTSSRSYSADSDSDFYTAMEGVKFSDIPLLADSTDASYQQASKLVGGDFAKMRLYAMGADAWALANKFNEFSKIPGYKVSGLTGDLTAGKHCNIERRLSWLQYRNGTVEQAY